MSTAPMIRPSRRTRLGDEEDRLYLSFFIPVVLPANNSPLSGRMPPQA